MARNAIDKLHPGHGAGLSAPVAVDWSKVPEFGSVKTEDGFKGLYAMDAYGHVKDGEKYPAVLLTTGATDPRVATATFRNWDLPVRRQIFAGVRLAREA